MTEHVPYMCLITFRSTSPTGLSNPSSTQAHNFFKSNFINYMDVRLWHALSVSNKQENLHNLKCMYYSIYIVGTNI